MSLSVSVRLCLCLRVLLLMRHTDVQKLAGARSVRAATSIPVAEATRAALAQAAPWCVSLHTRAVRHMPCSRLEVKVDMNSSGESKLYSEVFRTPLPSSPLGAPVYAYVYPVVACKRAPTRAWGHAHAAISEMRVFVYESVEGERLLDGRLIPKCW